MFRFYPVFKKELRSYFNSQIAYVIIIVFLLLSGFMFHLIFSQYSVISLQAVRNPFFKQFLNPTEGIWRPLVSNFCFILMVIIPMITMRLFAEEKRSGTIELLLSYPLKDGDIIAGKYFSALVVLFSMIIFTLVYALFMWKIAQIDIGALISGYFGIMLFGASFMAMGLWISSLTNNQVVASTITFGCSLFFWLIGFVVTILPPMLGKIISQISIIEHFSSFSKGVLNIYDLVYYVLFIIFFLFLTSKSLEARNWRG